MADLASLQVQLELQTAQFTEQMGKVNKQLDGLNKKVDGVSAAFGSLGKKLAAAISVGVVIKAFKDVLDTMDEMVKSSQKLGIATEELSALSYAASQSGVGFDQLSLSLRKLSVNMADVEKGTSESAKALRALGVTGTDSATTALAKIADAFAAIPDSVQKTALAISIFGKSGAELIPLLNEGAAGIEALTKRAAELGIVIDGQTAKQAELFNDSLDDMGHAMRGIVINITSGMLPSMSKLTKQMADSAKQSEAWKQFGEGVGFVLQGIAAALVVAAGAFRTLGTSLAAVAAASDALRSGNFAGAAAILSSLPDDIAKIRDETKTTVLGLLDMSKAIEQVGDAWVEDGDAQVEARFRAEEALKAIQTQATKTAKAVKEVLNPMQQLIVDLSKQSEDKSNAVQALEFMAQLPPELFRNLGLTLEEVAEAQERLMKSAGVWTVLDQAIADVTSHTRQVEEFSAAWDVLVERLSSGEIDVEKFNEIAAALNKYKPAIDDAGSAAQDLNAEMKKLGDQISDSIGANANNAMNDLIDSFGEAEISFGDMVTAMLKDIAKLITQLLIVKPLMEAIKTQFGIEGFAMGGAFGGATGLPHGIYNRPTFFPMAGNGPLKRFASGGVLGESGPEAILPLKRNAQGELGVSGSGVQVNVYNQAQVEVSTRESQGADGQQVIDLYIDRRINERFGNGSMDKVMRANYGLGRAAGG